MATVSSCIGTTENSIQPDAGKKVRKADQPHRIKSLRKSKLSGDKSVRGFVEESAV
jgi:hypothetical protein